MNKFREYIQDKKNNIYYIGLFIISCFGLYIRTKFAINILLWLDEASSYSLSRLTFTDLILQNANYYDYNHPTGYYLLVKCISLLSSQEFFLRLPSLLAYVGCVIIIYKIGTLFGSKIISFIGILYFSLHPLFVTVGYWLRPYSVTAFFCLASIYLLCKNFYGNKKYQYILPSLFIALGIYFDYSALWLLISLYVLWGIFFFLKNKFEPMMRYIVVSSYILISPQLFVLVTHFEKLKKLNVHIGFMTIGQYIKNVADFTGLLSVNYVFNFALIVLIIILILRRIVISYRNKTLEYSVLIFFLVLLLVPIISNVIYLQFARPLFQPKNLFVSHLSIIFCLSILLNGLYRFKKLRVILVICVVLLGCLLYSTSAEHYYTITYNWKEMADNIDHGFDTVIYIGSTSWKLIPLTDYYTKVPKPLTYKLHLLPSVPHLDELSVDAKKTIIFLNQSTIDAKTVKNIEKTQYCITHECKIILLQDDIW